MPLTLAHPAVVLGFSKKSKYFHFIALVLGSMSPDFEYFLNGMPSGALGHSLVGFFTYNLPIIVIVYILYIALVHKLLFYHLPAIIQLPVGKRKEFTVFNNIVFIYSSFIGFVTHIVWDSFTHLNGYMVNIIEFLNYLFIGIPIYKYLQHGGTLLGLVCIFSYMFYFARKEGTSFTASAKQKWRFWFCSAGISILLLIGWFIVHPVSVTAIGVHVVRIIDCVFLSLLITGIYYKWKKREIS